MEKRFVCLDDALYEVAKAKTPNYNMNCIKQQFLEYLGGLPIAENVIERRTAKWVAIQNGTLVCGSCGKPSLEPTPYCPHCGDVMEEI